MRVLTCVVGLVLLGLCGAQHAEPGELEPLDNIDEKEFEKYFHLDPVEDPEEFKKRNEALKKNEEEMKKINKEYQEGEKTWFDSLNEFADLPEDEFLQQKTGVVTNITMGRGLMEPLPEEREDQESERYFDQFRYSRASVPASYSSVAAGIVSPVKNQMGCGSCVSFATTATVETCFKKITNKFADYSEQQFVDCAYKQNGANGCKGASPHAYTKYAGDNKLTQAHESQYPYLNKKPNLRCPSYLPKYNIGARVSGSYHTYRGDEELMKKLVYEHGAVVATVKSKGPFQQYKGGLFAGCAPGSDVDHAITVVGYGRERGVNYWLIKNSWAPTWGESGFIRLKRGVSMCGIGAHIALVTCERVGGSTNAPLTTQKPCIDKYSNCAQLARTSCWDDKLANDCAKSCGMCSGMRPAYSRTCYNKFSNCNEMTSYCNQDQISSGCKKACGLC